MSDPTSDGEIRQQADHAQGVTQIGHAGNVTINQVGGSSAPPPDSPRGRLSANQVMVIVAIIGLIGTLAAAVIGILPDVLPASPSATATETSTATVMPTETPTATSTESPTVMPTNAPTTLPATSESVALASEMPTSPPTPTQVTATPTDIVEPVKEGFAVTLYRDADSLTLYLPDQGTISLEGFAFDTADSTRYELGSFNFGLPLDALPTPLCLRLERSGTTTPLPLACGTGLVINRALADADVFWHDRRQALPILIRAGSVQVGIVGTDSAEYRFTYPAEASTLSIVGIDVGTWDHDRQDCYATVRVQVDGPTPITGQIHVWNASYSAEGDVLSTQVYALGESTHSVTLGGREEQYKVHEIWISSDLGTSNRVGNLVCANWGQ